MTGLFYVTMVLLGVCFIMWQFKMLKKYTLTYDKLILRPENRTVTINERTIGFDDIDCVTVQEKQQPAMIEKALSKSACYAYMAEIQFHLHSGETIPCVYNTKGALYQILKKLDPFIPVKADINKYKPQIAWGGLIILVAAMIFIVIAACRG